MYKPNKVFPFYHSNGRQTKTVTGLEIDFQGPKDNHYDRADEQSYLNLKSVEITECPTFTFKFIYCARSPEEDITPICFITI